MTTISTVHNSEQPRCHCPSSALPRGCRSLAQAVSSHPQSSACVPQERTIRTCISRSASSPFSRSTASSWVRSCSTRGQLSMQLGGQPWPNLVTSEHQRQRLHVPPAHQTQRLSASSLPALNQITAAFRTWLSSLRRHSFSAASPASPSSSAGAALCRCDCCRSAGAGGAWA